MNRRSVTRLPALPGLAAWNANLGPAPVYAPAAEAGRIAEGSAGRNSGFMIDLNREAIGFAGAAMDDYGIDRNFFDRAGKVNGAASDTAQAHNRSYAAHLASLGEGSEMHDAQDMRELTGSAYYRSRLYTPGTVMLQPAGYIRGLAAGLARAGVTLYEQSPVTALTREGAAWRLDTPGGAVSAGRVTLTVNGRLESFGFEKGRLMQVFLYAVMTPGLDAEALKALGGQSRWGITPSDPMSTTVRRNDSGQGGNRIVTRPAPRWRRGTGSARARWRGPPGSCSESSTTVSRSCAA
ncbi:MULTISPECIES: NAD(P)/FAD-dependent oxidoreductase [Mameliella]|uniref:NAD(P)/FAD-dependent oxidoreductase n=1 Tax=Mameliella TaxID=1434019 RepID=UPI0018389824|nr:MULTISPECIES: FAD-dependent oxidoreductase [Mameliella]MCR9274827.1 FAD-binding oxidoreductase [Paracoccaceae bacterium]